ncbi:GntR family transcriptional regulator [Paracoccus spongiarum]|uniref:GntR family transcriptional regulator n=1 Tax=Paracoccus spongiarum TaxID=3064387 RepID=A0ABT9JBG4_9RHOB|nr:GntR family transcriptional regulator [Paracoccus sp. 2205BS29-5]MDP5307143.1 GntR family transcriptional regulator [Paracoccus sp. 2205BS29-5]
MTKIPSNVARSLRPASPERGMKRMNTWQSVRAVVMERIRSREWPPGELIPTEQQLAVQLGCARATVNRALRELADSGIIERRRKVGTRVTATPSRRTTLEMPVIRHEVEALGQHYEYRLTGYATSVPTEAAMRALQVGAEDELVLIKAQHLADNQPHCCEAIWLNPRVLPHLTRADVEAVPAHEWLARNVPLTHGQFSILAEGASGDCARNLRVEPGTPVLAIERLNWTDATPVSFARQFYSPQHRLISED